MIELRTLGQLTLEGDDAVPVASILTQAKRLALLVHLSCGRPLAPRSRDTLLALFWPELDDAHARTALRQALHLLRRSLGAEVITGAGEGRVGVEPARLWCDAAAFGEALERGDAAGALALYRGPFLEGFHVSDAPEFERWVDRERRRLEVEAVGAAWGLAERARVESEPGAARKWAERAMDLSPFDEVGFRRYLGILEAQADGAAAATAFAAYERRLAEELGLAPSEETLRIMDRIRAACRPGARRAGGLENGEATPSPAAGAPEERRSGPAPLSRREVGVEPMPVRVRPVRRPRRLRWTGAIAAIGGAGVIAALALAVTLAHSAARARRPPPIGVAVLPFRNLSADPSRAYFAAALHDELLDRLGRASSLRVVGRTSVADLGETARPLRQVASELGVTRVVEGSVQVVGDRLRVVAQLLDPATGAEVWVEHYDRNLDDAFAVQSEIAERIVAAVGATLTRGEVGAMRAAPTQDAAAYQLYLQGLEYARRPALRKEDAEAALQLFERALALDSSFAPAHAQLSLIDWRIYDLHDPDPRRLALARREAATALSLAPDLPEGHLAAGLSRYLPRGDARGALAEFAQGLRGAPSDAELWAWTGRTYRQLGIWDSAFAALDQAHAVEPRDATLWFSIAETRHYLHRYPEAIDAYRQALALAPDMRQAHISLAWSYFLWQGQLDTLRSVLWAIPVATDPGAGGGSILQQRILLLLATRRPDSVLAILRGPDARELGTLRRALYTGDANSLRGDRLDARLARESALALLDAALRRSPADWGLHATRGIVLGKLGRHAEALREARWLEASSEGRNDHYADLGATRALVLVMGGATDAALDELDRALAGPSRTTVPLLRAMPEWDPVRGDPRFQALMRKYANPPRQ